MNKTTIEKAREILEAIPTLPRSGEVNELIRNIFNKGEAV